MPGKDRCQRRVPVDSCKPYEKTRSGMAQVLPAALPPRHDRRQHIQRPRRLIAQIQITRELIGKHLPAPVQSLAGTGHEVFPGRLIRLGQPTLGVIDDADGRIAIADDVHHPPDHLIALGEVFWQQIRLGKRQPQMNQDRRTFGENTAVGLLQRWNLLERIELFQGLGRLRG
ncbi:hypothetical protein AEQ67_25205 [Pseudomonas sp. RIT-PI-q]|nr:hypothetical protein AEQ67_25205 [Pseudomonas sp. RIT-PI-q]